MRRAGVEPAQPAGGWVTATEARQCPADAFLSTLGGIRTHALHRERVATTPGWSARATSVPGVGFEPTRTGSKPASLPLADPGKSVLSTQYSVLARAEGEGVEPSRLIARPGSSRMPSPFGLPFRSFTQHSVLSTLSTFTSLDGWIRTSVVRLPRPADETRLSYIQIRHSALSPQHSALTKMGPEGFEPSPRWLRARDAAANTWIPINEKGQASRGHLALSGSTPRGPGVTSATDTEAGWGTAVGAKRPRQFVRPRNDDNCLP